MAGVREAGVSAAGGLASALSTHVPCHLGPVVLGPGSDPDVGDFSSPRVCHSSCVTPELVKAQAVGVCPGSPSERWGQDSSPGLPAPHLVLLRWGAGRLSGTAALTIKHILFMIVMKGRRVALCLRTGSLQLGGDLKTS